MSSPNMDTTKARGTLTANIQVIKKDIQYKRDPKHESHFQVEMVRIIQQLKQ